MKEFTKRDLMFEVATFNADSFVIETEEDVNDVMDEIQEHGASIITDEDERAVALAKLDIPYDSTCDVYRAGGCIFTQGTI